MNIKKYYFIFIVVSFVLFNPCRIYAQEKKVLNLPGYNEEWLHFGFSLGLNSANFSVHTINDFYLLDTALKTIQSDPQLGFNLGIISDLRLHEFLSLRFLPELAFAQRNLEYHFEGVDTITRVKKIESTFLNFPLDVKVKSNRINNFGVYVLGGVKYSIDLASQKNVNNSNALPGQEVIKLRKNDFGYEVGGGIEFFLPYFKFGIEAKLALGLKNLLIKEEHIYSKSLEKLNSKVLLISFTFEG